MCQRHSALNLHGLPEMPLADISIANADITAQTPGSIIDGKDIALKNVRIHSQNGSEVHVQDVQNLITDGVQGIGQGSAN